MLNVSIVIYKHTFKETESLIRSILGSEVLNKLFIIDNSPTPSDGFKQLEQEKLTYFFTGRNIGYGAGHNIALRKTMVGGVTYHLVLNPDIIIETNALKIMTDYMDEHSDVGHMMPKVVYPSGDIQYLCKLLPTPFDLLFRRFLPEKWIDRRTKKFEMRNSGYDKIMEVPYLSGCCMLLRTKALQKAGLFDERFFLYPEDIDLTRRIGEFYQTIFYPHVTVVHHHAKGSYKNFKLMVIHIWNLIKYFNKWGWLCDDKRKTINQKLITKWDL